MSYFIRSILKRRDKSLTLFSKFDKLSLFSFLKSLYGFFFISRHSVALCNVPQEKEGSFLNVQ